MLEFATVKMKAYFFVWFIVVVLELVFGRLSVCLLFEQEVN